MQSNAAVAHVQEEGLVDDEGTPSADDTEAVPAQAATDSELKPGIMKEIDRLSAENQQLRTQSSRSKPDLRVSPKGGVSVYGLGRFPVTLYKGEAATNQSSNAIPMARGYVLGERRQKKVAAAS